MLNEAKLCEMKPSKAAYVVEEDVSETLSYMVFQREHRTRIHANSPLSESCGRVAGLGLERHSNGTSALMLVAIRLRYVADTRSGTMKYLDTTRHTHRRVPTNKLAIIKPHTLIDPKALGA